jgi:RsiW-degrading membrane proteinase PrsW (M82 family)
VADWQPIAVLVGLAVVPAILFLVGIRNRERSHREPYGAVLSIFLYGAVVGFVVAFLLNTVFHVATWLYTENVDTADFLTAIISAPFLEEAVKATGFSLAIVRRNLDEWEDGIVYGAAVGIGFAMSENMLYGFSALAASGITVAILVIVVRVLSAMVLHAGASAILGYGIGQAWMRGEGWGRAIPYYLLAVLLHVAYNFINATQPFIAFVLAVAMVWLVLAIMMRRVRSLETPPHDTLVVMTPRAGGRPAPAPTRAAHETERPPAPGAPPHELDR